MTERKKILIVDDELNIRLLVKAVLGNYYDVIEACDGDEALITAREEKPDLILLDIMMPGKDGFTTCNALKSDTATKDIPVVMLTALQHRLTEKLAQSLNANGYVRKPFTSHDILTAIDTTLSAETQSEAEEQQLDATLSAETQSEVEEQQLEEVRTPGVSSHWTSRLPF
jgi:DNA-binding response OmpR family regulator